MNTEFVNRAMSESSGLSSNVLTVGTINSQVQRKLRQWNTCHFCNSPSVCVLSTKQLGQLVGVCEEHKLEHSTLEDPS